jgi:hypothetical protein
MFPKIYWPNKEVCVQSGILHNKKSNHLYRSPHGVMIMKSRELQWVEHTVLMGTKEVCTQFRWENLLKSLILLR